LKQLSRRQFLHAAALGAAMLTARTGGAAQPAKKSVSLADAFDREVERFMSARKVPGGALAVVKERKLVYARGYGWADRDRKIAARADSLFRIASLSKPITAVAALKLAEEGKLELDARAFDLVRLEPFVEPGRKRDARLAQITVRQLLQHTGGWDRDRSFDPMFRPREIARVLGVECPPGPRDVIRYMLGQPLDFDPGQRYAYSNFGYCVLGRVIEAASGQGYAKFAQEKILAPLGIQRARLGASPDGRQAEGEVRYYTASGATTESVFPQQAGEVPSPYGGFHLEAMDAHGGWIASAVDLARFAAALDDPRRSPLLNRESFRTMYAPPAPPVARNSRGGLKDSWYGCGWSVRPVSGRGAANYWHTGSLPGTFALLVRRWDGVSWVVLFNQRSENKSLPDAAIDAALHRAADTVTEWPAHDLFQER
jgi:N-acyl-D-amino-acid deacylase